MIKFIIGENASGKSLYLDNIIKADLDNHSEVEFVTNTYEIKNDNIEYDKDRLSVLEDISGAEEIDTSNSLLAIVESPVKLSKEFLQLMTILCQKCKRAYLDEPEQGLSEYEINILSSFLMQAGRTYEDMVIVTHSELLIQIPNCVYATPKMRDNTADIILQNVKDGDKFEVID